MHLIQLVDKGKEQNVKLQVENERIKEKWRQSDAELQEAKRKVSELSESLSKAEADLQLTQAAPKLAKVRLSGTTWVLGLL